MKYIVFQVCGLGGFWAILFYMQDLDVMCLLVVPRFYSYLNNRVRTHVLISYRYLTNNLPPTCMLHLHLDSLSPAAGKHHVSPN